MTDKNTPETTAPDTENSSGEHSNHSHSSHSHSSHSHSSHGSHSHRHRSKSKKSSSKKKKKIEITRKVLIAWVAILTVAVMLLLIWNVQLSFRLTSTADHLHSLIESTGGTSAPVTNDPSDKTPDYVKAEAERVAESVSKVARDDTISFFAISDMHLDITDSDMVNALTHAGMAMGIIREETDIDFAVNLGDITAGTNKTRPQTAKTEIEKAAEILKPGFKDIPNFAAVGNHDLLLTSYAQNKDYFDSNELYDLIGKQNDGATFQQGEKDRNYCYRDFADAKLRVITLNTNDIKNVTDESVLTTESKYCVMSVAQLKWLEQTLKMSDKPDAGDWKILIFSHIPLYTGGYEYVTDLLDGYNYGTAGSINVKGEQMSYDFTGSNSAKIIANVHGHLHNYRSDVIGKTKIPALGIPNACFSRNNSKATSGSEEYQNRYGEKVTYNKTYGTKDDTAFCVVTIDLKYNRIYATCYGAGYDREISF